MLEIVNKKNHNRLWHWVLMMLPWSLKSDVNSLQWWNHQLQIGYEIEIPKNAREGAFNKGCYPPTLPIKPQYSAHWH